MDQPVRKRDDTKTVYKQRCYHEMDEIDKRQALREERRELERERKKLEREKREFSIKKKVDDKRAETEKQLFQMKWKLLEAELVRLANDRQQMERQRSFYRSVQEFEKNNIPKYETNVVKGEMFFIGVENEQALKKRYKDLIKIYHPDNLGGDTKTLQEINKEYNRLKSIYQ